MSDSLRVTYTLGTHRLVSPQETLRRIRPVLSACGITRCACVTRLDELGIPVHCAVRPTGLVLQVSNGKGVTRESAQASALMEAIELHHAENPEGSRLRRTTCATLRREGAAFLTPPELDGWSGGYFGPEAALEWTQGEDLRTGDSVWVPASAIYFARSPSPITTNSNGLASGNHPLEATLHALYELIERDAASSVSDRGRLLIRERCRPIRSASIGDEGVRALIERVEARDTKVILLWVESRVPVHTFWAVFLNRASVFSGSTLNIGWGTHPDRGVAAFRALSEAAQSRLVCIHGAREDFLQKPVYGAQRVDLSAGYRFFDALDPSADWDFLPDYGHAGRARDLGAYYRWLLEQLDAAGQRLIRFDLTKPGIGVPVVKVLAPGLRFNQRMY